MHHIKASRASLRQAECFRFLHRRAASPRMNWAFHSAVMKGSAVSTCSCAEKAQDEIRHTSHNLRKITTLVDSGSYCLKEMSPDSKYTPFFFFGRFRCQAALSHVVQITKSSPGLCQRQLVLLCAQGIMCILHIKTALQSANVWDISCYVGIFWPMWGSGVMPALSARAVAVSEKETAKPLSFVTQRKTTTTTKFEALKHWSICLTTKIQLSLKG